MGQNGHDRQEQRRRDAVDAIVNEEVQRRVRMRPQLPTASSVNPGRAGTSFPPTEPLPHYRCLPYLVSLLLLLCCSHQCFPPSLAWSQLHDGSPWSHISTLSHIGTPVWTHQSPVVTPFPLLSFVVILPSLWTLASIVTLLIPLHPRPLAPFPCITSLTNRYRHPFP